MFKMLTKAKEKFVVGLASGLTQVEAYRAAYKCPNASDKTVGEKACRLFAKEEVRNRYYELLAVAVSEMREEGVLNRKKIIAEIASIAFSDMGDYLKYRTEKVPVGIGENGVIYENDIVVDFYDSTKVKTKNISEISRGKDGQFKFKLYNKDTALYKLAEYAGLSITDFSKEIQKKKLELEERKVIAVERAADDLEDDADYEIEDPVYEDEEKA